MEITILERKKKCKDLLILFSDKDLVVVEKPVGLLSVATDFQDYSVHTLLKQANPGRRVYPVHRLDRDVGGVMVFALSTRARDHLKTQFEKRTIEREYRALIEGHLEVAAGKWEAPLWEDPRFHVHVKPYGKTACTHFKVLKKTRHQTLLSLKLETGRKNQIRVHCAHAGHPLVGDLKYGAETNPYGRLCLHAHSLGFVHPVYNKKMRYTSYEEALPVSVG